VSGIGGINLSIVTLS